MLQFFCHKKFWLPLLIFVLLLITLEIFLRAGLYDKWLSPHSLLNNSIKRKAAIYEIGLDNIHWITLGDSRTDRGLAHELVQKEQAKKGLNHARLTFPRSKLPAYQTLSNWSYENLPNFQGILLGMPQSNFAQPPNPFNQEIIVWAFKDYLPSDYINQQPVNNWTPFVNLYNKTYISDYLHDIKDLARRLSTRLQEINQRQANPNRLFFAGIKDKHKSNICAYNLDKLKSCHLTAQNLSKKSQLNRQDRQIIRFCGNDAQKQQLDEKQISTYTEQWLRFFRQYLDKGISITIILFPQHPIFDYLLNPDGTQEVQRRTLNSLANQAGFRVIDLRHIFSEKKIPPCSVFSDVTHFNPTGRQYFSNALIREIKKEPLK